MAKEVGLKVSQSSKKWKWFNRNVYLVDGTILTMMDTLSNCLEYPKSLYKGVKVGFPKLRFLGIFCASSGAFLDGEIATYSGKGQSEPSLLLKVLDRIEMGSILVLDRFFTSLSLQSIMQSYGVDYVIRGREKFVKKHLKNKKDKVIKLKKDTPEGDSIYLGMEYEKFITVRLIIGEIKRNGFRNKKIFIVTSLFNVDKKEVEKIYLKRWDVELDFRNFKITMESDELKSKTPQGVRKELYVRLLGYNLVRKLTVDSSINLKTGPRKRSFKITLKLIFEISKTSYLGLLSILEKECLNSKYRREPRALKRRKMNYPLLTTSRNEAKKQDWGYGRRRPYKAPKAVIGALNVAS